MRPIAGFIMLRLKPRFHTGSGQPLGRFAFCCSTFCCIRSGSPLHGNGSSSLQQERFAGEPERRRLSSFEPQTEAASDQADGHEKTGTEVEREAGCPCFMLSERHQKTHRSGASKLALLTF